MEKIRRKFGSEVKTVITGNPYRLVYDIQGVGFLTADKIAGRLAIPDESPLRINAAIRYEIFLAQDEGHTCLPTSHIKTRVRKRTGVSDELIEGCISNLEKEGVLIRRVAKGILPAYFLHYMDGMEKDLAYHLKRLSKTGTKGRTSISWQRYCQWCREALLLPDKQQYQIFVSLGKSQLIVLTGGPGTGKTTLVKLILASLKGLRIKLASPTGRASQRLSETTGFPAATLHRLLEYDPKTRIFNYHSRRKLPADVVIIDESSMLDTELAAGLCRALNDGCKLIFIGDVDQLPSVGPGSVLADIINSGIAEVIRLKHIFRQSAESCITVNAHRILNGSFPLETKSDDQEDFYFISKDDPEEIQDIVSRLPKRLSRHLSIDPIMDVQVICPMYRGSLGINHLNLLLREKLNPKGREITMGQHIYRERDKVMQIKNNYEHEIFNGDQGRILSVNDDGKVKVQFASQTVLFPLEMMDQLVPAYASSIHKAQGSEYPAVIIPLHTQHYMMLKRQLLYTAVTRGKNMVVLVGSRKALGIALSNQRQEKRFTMLKNRISGVCFSMDIKNQYSVLF